MTWWFAKPKPRVVESVGPDEPRVLLKAMVDSHRASGHDDTIIVALVFPEHVIKVQVPRSTAARLPTGRIVTFELVNP